MGIIEKLKRFFMQDEEESTMLEKEPETRVEQQHQQSTDQQQQTITQYEPVQQEPTLLTHQTSRIDIVDTSKAIENWEKTLQAVQQHPLSQVKIINTQILEEITHVLKSMDSKMNKLDELDKIDEIYDILLKTQTELESKGIRSEHLTAALSEIERLTIKDKDVIDWISKQDQVTAQQLADRINLSRSTASFRLNRLAELGVLIKEAIGKKIYYKIKNMPKFPEETRGHHSGQSNVPETVQTEPDEFA
jgi:DNA-binding transcriptional ArsR family regulator